MPRKRSKTETCRPASVSANLRVPPSAAKCVVCGSPVAQFSSEDLCWVCRRLKISAWRESDSQAAMQD